MKQRVKQSEASPRWKKYARWMNGGPGRFEDITDVVIVPPKAALSGGVALARSLCESGAIVALVGHGAGFLRASELGVTPRGRVCLIELGGFSRDQVASTADVRREIDAWLAEIFSGLPVPELEQNLYASAAVRLFQGWIDAAQFTDELAAFVVGRRVHSADPCWPGNRAVGLAPSERAPRWKLWPYVMAGLCATVLSSGKSMLVRRSTVEALAHFRSVRRGPPPRRWLVLQNEWYRFNRHLIDSLAAPMVARGEPLGVLLAGDLQEGLRSEVDLTVRGRGEFFSGLGSLRKHLDHLWLDQVVGPESWSEWWRVCQSASRSSLAAAARATFPRPGPRTSFDPFADPKSFARLLTIDVARAAAAFHAARVAGERSVPAESEVYSSTSTLAAAAAADSALRRAGHTTVEFFHGAGAEEWSGAQECRSSVRAVWTEIDAQTLRRLGQRAVAAGMPSRTERHPPRREPPWRVLLLSNYVHRDLGISGHFPFEPFLRELLRVPTELAQIAEGRFQVRWRPHPADHPDALSRAASHIRDLPRSSESLEEDFAWADCIVSSMSTTVVEAMFVGVPVFLHVPPQYEEAPNVVALAPERRFFYAQEGARKIAEAFLHAGAVDTDPERRTQALFLGPTLQPRPLSEALRSL